MARLWLFVARFDVRRYSKIAVEKGYRSVASRHAICGRCVMPDSQPFIENRDAGTLAQAIVDGIKEYRKLVSARR